MSRRFELLRMLEEYQPSASEERPWAEMLDLIRGGGDPFSQYRYDPGHFTVGAFVVSSDGLVLVHHRRLDMWLEPGGHIDPGDESIYAAAVREIEEETGLADVTALVSGIFDLDAHPIPAYKGEPPHRHFNIGLAFSAPDGEALVHQPDEAHDVIWHPLDRVAELTGDKATLRAVAKLAAL